MPHKKCANCGDPPHPGGSCNTIGCKCDAYDEALGKPDGKPAKGGTPPTDEGASVMPRRIQQYAPGDTAVPGSGDAASGSAASGADPSTLVANLDNALDTATSAVAALDLTTVEPEVQTFAALVFGASTNCDLLMSVLGVSDPDSVAAPTGSMDTVALAEAVDATIVAARNIADSLSSGDVPDGLQPAIDAIHSADEISGDLLDALGTYDPDEEDGTDVDPDTDDTSGDGGTDDSDMVASARARRYRSAGRRRSMADGEPGEPGGTPAPGEAPDTGTGVQFRMPVMVLEGVDTGDGRYIRPEALTWRELPLPVMVLTETNDFGHTGAQLCGRIDTIERVDYSAQINPKTGQPYGNADDGTPIQALVAEGVFNNSEMAAQVADDIRGQFLRGVSVDIGDVESDLEFLDDDGNPVPEDTEPSDEDILDIFFFGGNFREVLTAGRVMGATICPFPAFEGAYVELPDGASTQPIAASARPYVLTSIRYVDEFALRSCEPCADGRPLVAAAGPLAPPRIWFEDPALESATPITITDDGRIFGHLAAWGTCHTGYGNRCVTPPRDPDGSYSYFRTGALRTAEGDVISIGHLTMATGHADTTGPGSSAAAALAHYDNTGTVFADVAAGEDAHGIWVAGAMRPDLDEFQVHRARASALSGDWRQIGGKLRLIAALGVNTPGYPVVRAHVAGGATQALVAAGAGLVLMRAKEAEIPPALKKFMEQTTRALADMKRADLRRQVHGR